MDAALTADDLALFQLPPDDPALDPRVIAARLAQLPEHQHFADHEIDVAYLMRADSKVKAGRLILGEVREPMVQGDLRGLFYQLLAAWLGRVPQYLIILDADWWREATPLQREALVFHEMAHVKQALDKFGAPKFDKEGKPVWTIVGHDIEEFRSVVARYGRWSQDIADFLDAVA